MYSKAGIAIQRALSLAKKKITPFDMMPPKTEHSRLYIQYTLKKMYTGWRGLNTIISLLSGAFKPSWEQ